MSTTFVLVWAVILLGILAMGSFAWHSANKRREALRILVASMGFDYVPTDPDLLDRFGAAGAPFDRGFDRRAANVLSGNWDGRSAIAFDYSYKIRSGGKNKSTTRHFVGIVCLDSGLLMPHLSVLPESVASRTVDELLGDDIQLANREFSQTFSVTSANPSLASEVLDDAMTTFLLFHPHEGFKIHGTQVMRVTRGHFQPSQLRSALAYADAVLERIPQHVRRSLRAPDQG